MADKRRRVKRREDDDLASVQRALSKFDLRSPVGAYKIDEATARFQSKRSIRGATPIWLVRCFAKRCCAAALNAKWNNSQIPLIESETKSALERLERLRECALEVQKINSELLSRGAWVERHDNESLLDDDQVDLSVEEQLDRIEDGIRSINRIAQSLVQVVDHFDSTIHPFEWRQAPPRTILFTFHFIQEMAKGWKGVFIDDCELSDVSDMTDLMLCALEDFDYPLAPSQRHSYDWLSDRIRKQISKN